MSDLSNVLDALFGEAERNPSARSVTSEEIGARIEYVATCLANRAGVRLVMSCMLAKIDNPKVDPREPITEIGSTSCFSGRMYDERYLTPLITKHRLPCNNTTAYLTPAFRNFTRPFHLKAVPKGRPPKLYIDCFTLLEDVAKRRVSARDVMIDSLRHLISMRDEQDQRMDSLLGTIARSNGRLTPSSEAIAGLLEQHLRCKNSSRLPVIGVAAAYNAVFTLLGEKAMPLKSHTSADVQTRAAGDVEIHLVNDDDIVTVYEMKKKAVILNDVDQAVTKIVKSNGSIDNYIIITTDPIPVDVAEYARSMYDRLDGTEVVVLDYLGFIRHFLHFFHRYRAVFLDSYQALVLAEPASAVPQSLMEAFLALRNALQSDEEAIE